MDAWRAVHFARERSLASRAREDCPTTDHAVGANLNDPRSCQDITKADTIIYRASQSDCATCPIKERCCPNTPVRKIARSIHEAARDVARRIRTTAQYQRSRYQRKKVEMLFAHLKRILKLDRLRLRGLSGASDEFTLAAAVQNLRRLVKLVPRGPPPQGIGAPA